MPRRKRAGLSSPIAGVGFACRGWVFGGIGDKRGFQGRPWVEWLFRHEDGRQMTAAVPKGWQHTEAAIVDMVISLNMQAYEQSLSLE